MTTTPPQAASTDDPAAHGAAPGAAPPATEPVPLRLVTVEMVEPDGPFDPRTTLIKPSHFPSPFDTQGEHDNRAVTFVNGHPTGLRASFTDEVPAVRLEIYLPAGSDADPAAAAAVLRTRLGLDLALPGYADLCAGDEVLSRLPPAMHGARPSSPWSLYEYLSIGTVLQNTTVSRTVQMARALADLLGTWYRFPDGPTLASFWHPGDVVDLGEAALREAKLGYRAKTLTRLGTQFHTDPDTEMRLRALAGDASALRAGLRALYGVGPATTGYLMFDVFKSLDELAHLPPWEAKILGRLLFDDPDTDPAHTITWCHDHWAPYTMLATHAVFETVFWHRTTGNGPAWLDDLIRL
jgi:3-methyladenine DNA glycosylase/8-oxoguanine DNA glycosylase